MGIKKKKMKKTSSKYGLFRLYLFEYDKKKKKKKWNFYNNHMGCCRISIK